MNEIIISQLCSAETISISTGGIQGDVYPAVDGSAYEELMLSLQYCMEYILGEVEDGLCCLVLLMALVSLLAQRQTPILLVLLVGYITLWWYIGPILLYVHKMLV